MTVKLKEETAVVEKAYVHCDMKDCDSFTPATGMLNAVGWLTAVMVNEDDVRRLEMEKMLGLRISTQMADKVSRHLCPNHAALFEKFVNNSGKDGTI